MFGLLVSNATATIHCQIYPVKQALTNKCL